MATADLVIRAGRVFTSGRPGSPRLVHPVASAVAVAGERIVAIGTDRELESWIGHGTQIVDAAGGLIMPGFDDAHMHLRMGAISLDRLDLYPLGTLPEVHAAIAAYARSRPDATWIAGRGWLYAAFPGGMPTSEQLDAVVPDRPAYFECFDGHSGWANSRALELAGIGPDTPDPPDGRIVRDAAGRPTGALKERATELVEAVMPAPTDEETLDLVSAALRRAAGLGITAIQDAWATPDDLRFLRRLAARGDVPIRVRLGLEMVPKLGRAGHAARLDEFESVRAEAAEDPFVRTGILKSFVDGVVEARTAYLLEPYAGASTRGDPRWDGDELRDAVAEAHRRGWQVELHAIGTAAVRQALDAYEALGPGEAARLRHRVEHIETIDPADLGRFEKLGVVASMQPFHALPEIGQVDVWSSQLPDGVAASGWRLRSLLRSGAVLAFGSDWPVVPIDPLLEIHAAVTRRTVDGQPPEGWLAQEGLDIADALAAATWGSAYAEHAESERGHLSPGALADLIVLDRDLLAAGGDILGTGVRLTVVGGRTVDPVR